MNPQDVVPFDLGRMFLGDAPPLFLLEIVFRTVFLYGWLLLLLRLVRQRALAQLSIVEFGIVIALGSAAGDGLFYPEVPLLHAMLVILVVVLLQWGLANLINTSERVETFMEGRPVCLVESGRVDLQGLRRASLSTKELFERLRLAGTTQLGEVRFAFMEQGGSLSVFPYKEGEAKPGLPLVPPFDLRQPRGASSDPGEDALLACTNCGEVRRGAAGESCARCGHLHWTPATDDPLADLSSGRKARPAPAR